VSEKGNKKDSDSCIICLAKKNEPTTDEATIDGCEHTFCFECIFQWSLTSNTCPLCKVRFHKIKKASPQTHQTNMVLVPNRDQIPEYTPEELMRIVGDDAGEAGGDDDDGYNSLDDFIVNDDDDGQVPKDIWASSEEEVTFHPYLLDEVEEEEGGDGGEGGTLSDLEAAYLQKSLEREKRQRKKRRNLAYFLDDEAEEVNEGAAEMEEAEAANEPSNFTEIFELERAEKVFPYLLTFLTLHVPS